MKTVDELLEQSRQRGGLTPEDEQRAEQLIAERERLREADCRFKEKEFRLMADLSNQGLSGLEIEQLLGIAPRLDYENAEYVISNQDGHQRGPLVGKAATKDAAIAWHSECGHMITVRPQSTEETVAVFWPDKGWMFPDLHDDEGNRLPYRREW